MKLKVNIYEIMTQDRQGFVLGDQIYNPLYSEFPGRVAQCHRYGRYICVNFLEVWGKILESNIRAFDIG